MTLIYAAPKNLEIKAAPSGIIEGYGSVFGVRDSQGDVVMPGAFAESLRQGLPVMLWSHDQTAPIGRWTAATEDAKGLHLAGQINIKSQAGRDAFEHLAAGDVTGLSIGFRLPAGAAQVEGDTRYLSRVDLAEVSVVALPANAAARVTSVKSQATKPQTIREFERHLLAVGYSKREAQAIAVKGFASAANVEADHSEELAAALLRIRAASIQF